MQPTARPSTALGYFLTCLFVVSLHVAVLASDDIPNLDWKFISCSDGETHSTDLEEVDNVILVSRCDTDIVERDKNGTYLCAESSQLLSNTSWRLGFSLLRSDSVGELHVDLINDSNEVTDSVVLDPQSCRLLNNTGESLPGLGEDSGREWMNRAWWLNEQHVLQLWYHASLRSISVRFDWNYWAMTDAPLCLDSDSFAFRIRLAGPLADVSQSTASFDVWDLNLSEYKSFVESW